MAIAQRVLVVDGLSETEEVLRAVLEPRGLRVDRIRRPLRSATESLPPSVVVLHVDEERDKALATGDRWDNVPRIVIGSAKLSDRAPDEKDEHYLEKPFQYGELIGAIERLLTQHA